MHVVTRKGYVTFEDGARAMARATLGWLGGGLMSHSRSLCFAAPPNDFIAPRQGTDAQGQLTAMLARVGLLPPQRVLDAPVYGMIAVVTYDTRQIQLEEFKRSSAQLVGSHYCSTPEVMKALQWLSGDWNDQVRHSRRLTRTRTSDRFTNSVELEHYAITAPHLLYSSGLSEPPPYPPLFTHPPPLPLCFAL